MLAAALALGPACTSGGEREAAPPPADAPAGTGTLRLGIPERIAIDPLDASPAGQADLVVLDLLYEGLTRLDERGRAAPALARSWESDDARTWRFTLAPEASFSDGTPVTVAHVAASLTRLAAAGPGSFAGTRLEVIAGYAELVAGEAEDLAGLVADPDDPAVLEVRLDRPFASLPELLAHPLYGIVDPDSVDSVDAGRSAALVTSGLLDVVAGTAERITLRPRAGGVHLDEVRLHRVADLTAAAEALAGGRLDWAPVPGDTAAPAGGGRVTSHALPAVLLLGFNTAVPLFEEPALRQAIAAALDRGALVDGLLDGAAVPLTSLVPPGVPGHDPDACGERCGADPEAARALLASAVPEGGVPEVVLGVDRSGTQRSLARAVARQLEAVGIPVEVRTRPLDQHAAAVAAGEEGFFGFGWIGLYPAPDAYLDPLARSGSGDNVFGWSDTDVDGWLQDAAERLDGVESERALQLWARAEQALLDAAIAIPVAQYVARVGVGPGVRGLVHGAHGTFDVAAVSVR